MWFPQCDFLRKYVISSIKLRKVKQKSNFFLWIPFVNSRETWIHLFIGFFPWESLNKLTIPNLNTIIFELGIRPDTSPSLASTSLDQLPFESPVEQRRRARFARGKPTFADIIDTFLVPEINALLTRLNHKLITTVEFVFQAGLKNADQSTFLKSPSLSDRAEEAVKRLCALLFAFRHYCDFHKNVSLQQQFYNVYIVFTSVNEAKIVKARDYWIFLVA